jgi:hypothetical protein
MYVGKEAKTVVFRSQIVKVFSAMEQKWLMRILLADLQIHLKYESVLAFLSPIALQRFDECSSLRTVCEEGFSNLQLKGLVPQIPFAPMLATGFPTSDSTADQVSKVLEAMKGSKSW